MTKKDYVLIAQTIKQAIKEGDNVSKIIELFCINLAYENPKFNKEIFIKAIWE